MTDRIQSECAPSILFLAIGEAHQLFHVLKTAADLHAAGARITLMVSTHWHVEIIRRYCPDLQGHIRHSALFLANAPIHKCPPRLPNLLLSAPFISTVDGVITPERTSTLLRFLPSGRRPKLIHIPHGAGDRAKSYDRRIRHFDLVLTAGRKDRDRFIARGLSEPGRTHVTGYGKLDLMQDAVPEFFEEQRPVILYNPHFDERLSSWLTHGEPLLRWFCEQQGFNVIVAPHLRITGRSRTLFEKLAARYAAPHLRFDGGSLHSVNMDYTRCADIYLGDVSSQVYEFLRTPGPCVFIDAHGANWEGSADYSHWRFGRVVRSVEEVVEALAIAASDHATYAGAQRAGYAASIGSSGDEAIASASDLILAEMSCGPQRTDSQG